MVQNSQPSRPQSQPMIARMMHSRLVRPNARGAVLISSSGAAFMVYDGSGPGGSIAGVL